MVKTWLWKKRQYIAIALTVIAAFVLAKHFSKVPDWALFVGPMTLVIIVNHVIYLIFGVDLIDFHRHKNPSAKSEPQQKPFEPLAEKVWLAIKATLAEGRYDWRTPESLSKETGIELAAVRGILEHDLGERGLVVCATDDSGCHYTTREHYMKIRTWRNRILTVLTDKIQ